MQSPANNNELGSLGLADVANADWYMLVFDFATIAAGGTASVQQTVDGAGSLTVTHFLGAFWTTATIGSSVAGTQLAPDSDPSSASNQLPNLAHLTMLISSRSWQWSNNPVRANLVLTNGRERNWFSVNPLIPPRDTITIALTNTSAVSVIGQIVMGGYRRR